MIHYFFIGLIFILCFYTSCSKGNEDASIVLKLQPESKLTDNMNEICLEDINPYVVMVSNNHRVPVIIPYSAQGPRPKYLQCESVIRSYVDDSCNYFEFSLGIFDNAIDGYDTIRPNNHAMYGLEYIRQGNLENSHELFYKFRDVEGKVIRATLSLVGDQGVLRQVDTLCKNREFSKIELDSIFKDSEIYKGYWGTSGR